jgi:hypothetical protein
MRVTAAILGWALCAACGNGMPSETETRVVIDEAFKKDLATLQASRVWFGHHSVGRNILDGLQALSKEAGVAVEIGEGPVGQNTRPLEKFEDFARRAERDPGDGVQLMVMKLCYVDFDPSTDVDELIRAYAASVERVKKARPGIRIVHVTPPLCARPGDVKSKLNRMLGRQVWEDDSNAKRSEFAKKLVAKFPGEPVFDLSRIESTRPDGTTESHDVGGRPVPMLWPGFTTDGGHLNELGSKVAAKAFAETLARALRQR